MIHVFSAKNFHSFKNEVTIDFRVDENAPKEVAYCTSVIGIRLSLVQAVMGPNASGKTTALRALAFLQWFLVKSLKQDRGEIPFMFFAGYTKKTSPPTELSVEFEMDGGIYIYSLQLT